MPRIHPVANGQADAQTQATLDAVKAKVGMVPNLYATFAQAPAVLNGFLALSDALSNGHLNARQREIVALATAQTNRCQYCLSAHTLLGKGAGLSPAAIADARQGKGVDPLDNAIAALAAKLVQQRGRVADSDLADAREAGLDDARILEVIANVSLNVLTNYTNNLADTDVDFPVVSVD